jgi:hypothetical protein
MFRLWTTLAAIGRGNERAAAETDAGGVYVEAVRNERAYSGRIEVILNEKIK